MRVIRKQKLLGVSVLTISCGPVSSESGAWSANIGHHPLHLFCLKRFIFGASGLRIFNVQFLESLVGLGILFRSKVTAPEGQNDTNMINSGTEYYLLFLSYIIN